MGKRGAAASHAVRRRRKALGETLDALLKGKEMRDRLIVELQDIAPLKEISSGEDKGTVYITRDAVLLSRLYMYATMDTQGDPKLVQHSIRATELLVDAALNRDRDIDEMERAATEAEDDAERAGTGVILMPQVLDSVHAGAAQDGSGEQERGDGL